MHWSAALDALHRANIPCVVLTVTEVRGHAPRRTGAKLVVTAAEQWGSIGGGNIEATAIARARELLAAGLSRTTGCEFLTARLTDKERNDYGRQCCGGEVQVLVEPIPAVPAVAVFGIGHVGLELARILARQDLELHLVDSRPEMLTAERLAVLDDAAARVCVHVLAVPEAVLAELPAGAQVLVLTHDHAEDFAIVDAALREPGVASIGLIGSSAKWARFRGLLADAGHSPEDAARVRCPIGVPGIASKEPAAIAVAVAAEVLIRATAPAGEGRSGR